MGTRVFGFLDTRFTVESKDEHTLTWLDEVLAPWFDSSARGRELDVTVRHERAPKGLPLDDLGPARILPFLILDSRVIQLPATRRGSRVVLDDAEEGCRYTVDGLDVSVEARDNTGRLCLMRLIREIAVEHERRHARSLELHAAAFELGGEAIAFAGPKGSGKTTLLLQAVAHRSAQVIANDRVLVDARTGRLRLTGVPAVIRIHPRTAAAFPALASGVPRTVDSAEMTLAEFRHALDTFGPAEARSELRLSGGQLARALPAQLRPAAPLRAVVFPEIGVSSASPCLSRLSSEEALERLRASIYGGRGQEDIPLIFTEMVTAACPRSQSADAVRLAKARLTAQLASGVQCFRLVPGPNLEAAIDRLLLDVLA